MGIAFVAANTAKLPVKILDSNPKQIEKGLAVVGTFPLFKTFYEQ